MCWRGHTDDGPHRVSALRREISDRLACAQGNERTTHVELVAGELVANVYRHAPGPFCVELHLEDGEARLSVHDYGDCFEAPVVCKALGELHESGRGIAILQAEGIRIDVLRGNDGGCSVTATFAFDGTPPQTHPTACPYDHPGRRGVLCPRVLDAL